MPEGKREEREIPGELGKHPKIINSILNKMQGGGVLRDECEGVSRNQRTLINGFLSLGSRKAVKFMQWRYMVDVIFLKDCSVKSVA